MARFSAVLLAAALLVAGRLSDAAPSAAEVFWRAALPDSAVPDAVLALLRPDNHFVSKAKPEDAGRPPNSQIFLYAEHKRSSATPANVPLFYTEHKHSSATPAGDNSAVGAQDPGDTDRNKGSSKRPASGSAGELISPFIYNYKTPTKHHHADSRAVATTTKTVFFHEEAVRVGERLLFHFPAAAPTALGLLPRRVADSIPFATAALPEVLTRFDVPPGSAMAAGMAETLRNCELPPVAGDAMFCATSLEALVERAMEALGTRDVRALTSTLPRAGAPLQLYTVRAVRPVDGASFVACHDEDYPYTVYRCHGTGPARAYMVEMEGARGGAVTVATVCHTDTSLWDPEHVSFKLLGTKPGGAPVCHLMPYGHITWAKNVKISSA